MVFIILISKTLTPDNGYWQALLVDCYDNIFIDPGLSIFYNWIEENHITITETCTVHYPIYEHHLIPDACLGKALIIILLSTNRYNHYASLWKYARFSQH